MGASTMRSGSSTVCAMALVALVVLVELRQVHGWFSPSNAEIFPSLTRPQSRVEESDAVVEEARRILASATTSGYIGYGALASNRVPCPPQSGRSYYTPNCASATGPVRPYQRGCSTITRCARSSD